ncbi:hypothetical protein HHE02_06190 [Helicobacter heilmannii]|uniref:Uncharacterized protein n=1 Tax=Helicobacter heilmannii TaxID=35817 RepID=A0A0K2XJ76_HELHE|nr:hypothetical protein BN341_5160 [Helicobacter heilmannii ASB1.4]CRF47331.1 hypothetical protein HHE02_06190 [Helicobacter heilmannii]CRF48706.1 hypothetical protein HHE03_02800 [Helicobacter heilmannii]CRF51604.1 hypothetical protein HHE06_14920 [Helicobacter heilmannii]CRI34247.1 hypothetical protein HHE01_10930 [Helicobacter heilmannii]
MGLGHRGVEILGGVVALGLLVGVWAVFWGFGKGIPLFWVWQGLALCVDLEKWAQDSHPPLWGAGF